MLREQVRNLVHLLRQSRCRLHQLVEQSGRNQSSKHSLQVMEGKEGHELPGEPCRQKHGQRETQSRAPLHAFGVRGKNSQHPLHFGIVQLLTGGIGCLVAH